MEQLPTLTRWFKAAWRPALLGVGVCGLALSTPLNSSIEEWERPRLAAPQDPDSPYAIPERTEAGLEPFLGEGIRASKPQFGGVSASTSPALGSKGLGGFAPGGNTPQARPAQAEAPWGEVSLIALPAWAPKGKPESMALVLANRGLRAIWISGSGRRLCIVQEAVDEAGRWRPIEFIATPRFICGYFHREVGLPAGQAWVFPAHRYAGPFKTRLRFRILDRVDSLPQFSNEFEGSIDPRQFRPELLEVDWTGVSVDGVRYEAPSPLEPLVLRVSRKIHSDHKPNLKGETRVLARLRVSAVGVPSPADSSEVPAELEPALAKAIKTWTFTPAKVDGSPIAVSERYAIQLRDKSPRQ